MPIYEYECGHCQCRFEIKQGFDDEPQAKCPECEGKARRIIRSSPVIFKGSGFYITDHRKSQDTDPGKGESKTGTGKGESKTSISKGESKTETSKGETKAGASEKGK